MLYVYVADWELIHLAQPEVVSYLIGVASQVAKVLSKHERAVVLAVDQHLIVCDQAKDSRPAVIRPVIQRGQRGLLRAEIHARVLVNVIEYRAHEIVRCLALGIFLNERGALNDGEIIAGLRLCQLAPPDNQRPVSTALPQPLSSPKH